MAEPINTNEQSGREFDLIIKLDKPPRGLLERLSIGGIEEQEAAARITKLEAQLARWKAAVESLTPSGSEFVDEPENCAAHIKSRMRKVIQFAKERNEAKAQLAEANARAEAAEGDYAQLMTCQHANLERQDRLQRLWKEAEARAADLAKAKKVADAAVHYFDVDTDNAEWDSKAFCALDDAVCEYRAALNPEARQEGAETDEKLATRWREIDSEIDAEIKRVRQEGDAE